MRRVERVVTHIVLLAAAWLAAPAVADSLPVGLAAAREYGVPALQASGIVLVPLSALLTAGAP
jgi:hypothetical protein